MLMVRVDIMEGAVRIGARVTSGGEIDVPVSAIEHLNLGPGKACALALGFRYADQTQLRGWLEANLPGATLVLENPPPERRAP
jgi:hypothetical protein